MDLHDVIKQIRTTPTRFGQFVLGAAEYARAERETIAVPRAFVFPGREVPAANTQDTGLAQRVREYWSVVVALDNSPDHRGEASANEVKAVRAELFRALLNWVGPGAIKGFEYEGANIQEINRARTWWQFDFAAEIQVTERDGFSEVPDGEFLTLNGKHFARLPGAYLEDGLSVTIDEDENLILMPDPGKILIAEDLDTVREF